MKRLVGLAASVVLTAVPLAACGSGGDADPGSEPTASASSGDADTEASRTPIADYAWEVPAVPADWTPVGSEDDGSPQWQVDGTECFVGLIERDDLGTDSAPRDEDIVAGQLKQILKAAGGGTAPGGPVEKIMVTTRAADRPSLELTQQFLEGRFETEDGAKGRLFANRYDNFALMAYAGCGRAESGKPYPGSIEDFLDSVVAVTTN